MKDQDDPLFMPRTKGAGAVAWILLLLTLGPPV
jgi:hypothetical protein